MTITARVLEQALAQKLAVAHYQNTQQALLVTAWVRAWDEINHDMQATISRMMAEAKTVEGVREWRGLALKRQQQALKIVSDQLQAVLKAANIQANQTAARLIQSASSDVYRLIQEQLPLKDHDLTGTITLTRADTKTIDAIVQRTTEQVQARHYYLQDDAVDAMKRELAAGVATGTNPKEAARKMLERVKGVFNGGLPRAINIARTEQMDAYRVTTNTVMAANRDVLTGWIWLAELSPRTCPSCIALHGTEHPLDEPGPNDHQQGRCVAMPVTKPWRELGFNVDDPAPAIKPGDGVAWLEAQPETVQLDILGARRFAAWKAGDYPPSQWSQLRRTPEWRDSYGVSPAPAVF